MAGTGKLNESKVIQRHRRHRRHRDHRQRLAWSAVIFELVSLRASLP
jgi:hypothetical protein